MMNRTTLTLPRLLIVPGRTDHLAAVASHLHLSDSQLAEDPDFHIVNSEENIKIEQVRLLLSDIVFAPTQATQSIWVITHLDLASVPAQNALLKILEEPPAYAQILLTAQDLSRILPTIQSRCEVISLSASSDSTSPPSPSPSPSPSSVLPDFTTTTYSQAIALSDQHSERDQALLLMENYISDSHAQIELQPDSTLVSRTQLFLKTRRLLQQNLNVRLVLEDCFFAQIRL